MDAEVARMYVGVAKMMGIRPPAQDSDNMDVFEAMAFAAIYWRKAKKLEEILNDATESGARYYVLSLKTFDGQSAEDLIGHLRGSRKGKFMSATFGRGKNKTFVDYYYDRAPRFSVWAEKIDGKNAFRVEDTYYDRRMLFDADSFTGGYSEHKDYYFYGGERDEDEFWNPKHYGLSHSPRKPFDGQTVARCHMRGYNMLVSPSTRGDYTVTDMWFDFAFYDKNERCVDCTTLHVPFTVSVDDSIPRLDEAEFVRNNISEWYDSEDISHFNTETPNKVAKWCYLPDKTVNYSLRNASFVKMMCLAQAKRAIDFDDWVWGLSTDEIKVLDEKTYEKAARVRGMLDDAYVASNNYSHWCTCLFGYTRNRYSERPQFERIECYERMFNYYGNVIEEIKNGEE